MSAQQQPEQNQSQNSEFPSIDVWCAHKAMIAGGKQPSSSDG